MEKYASKIPRNVQIQEFAEFFIVMIKVQGSDGKIRQQNSKKRADTRICGIFYCDDKSSRK